MKEKTLLGTIYGRGITIETDEIVTKEMVLKAFARQLEHKDKDEDEAQAIEEEIMATLGRGWKTVLSVSKKFYTDTL